MTLEQLVSRSWVALWLPVNHVIQGGCKCRPPPRLLDQVRDRIRLKHYSIRTEEAYVEWIRRFVLYHGKRHPRDMAAPEVESFLTFLAVKGRVAASTQNQAKSALLFLYKEVLGDELPWLDGIETAKRPQRLPIVLEADDLHPRAQPWWARSPQPTGRGPNKPGTLGRRFTFGPDLPA